MFTPSPQLLKFSSVVKCFGPKCVLDNLSFTISRGERLALIGENGSGKTTLARLSIGLDTPDAGTVFLFENCRTGYLPQEAYEGEKEPATLEALLLKSQGNLDSLARKLRELEEAMSRPLSDVESAQALEKWDDIHSRYVALNGYAATEKAREYLDALGLKHLSLKRRFSSLSCGEKRRAHLAALLLEDPDLLILDEPTNHLDEAAMNWLESYLCRYKGGILLISHDRQFLNRTANGILELSSSTHKLSFYTGTYDDYHREKKRELDELLDAFHKQKEEICSLKQFLKKETFAKRKPPPCKDGNKMAYDRRGERHAKGKKRETDQAKARLEELSKNEMEHPLPKNSTGISFRPKIFRGKTAIALEKISFKVNNKLLFDGLTVEFFAGNRIILNGPNGCGKSTLLKILAEKLRPSSGIIAFSPQIIIGHLDQEPDFDAKDLEKTLLNYLLQKYAIPEHELRSSLCRIGLIEGRYIRQSIGSLSLGQKRRLQLLELILCEANVLLLDEPTNHLAPLVIDQLEDALLSFEGTIIAATHDRRFAERIGTTNLDWKNATL